MTVQHRQSMPLMPNHDSLLPLLRATLAAVCGCGHLQCVHKKGEQREGCYSCECTQYHPRLHLVTDSAA